MSPFVSAVDRLATGGELSTNPAGVSAVDLADISAGGMCPVSLETPAFFSGAIEHGQKLTRWAL